MSDIETARKIAFMAHKGQTRKNGEDYINHCLRVSDSAKAYSEDAEILGILHDVIEDSDYTISDLQSFRFKDEIIDALRLLTHDKLFESYCDYIVRIKTSGNKLAINIKKCDLNDNLNGATGTLKDKYELSLYILNME